MDLNQLQAKIKTLESEIVLAQRKREQALDELERVNETKEKELLRHRKQIDSLRKQIDELVEKKAEAERLTVVAEDKYKSTSKDIKAYGERSIAEAQERVRTIYEEAEKKEIIAKAKLEGAKKRVKEMDIKGQEVIEREQRLSERVLEYESLKEELEEKERNMEARETMVNERVVKAMDKVRGLEGEIQSKSEMVEKLTETIADRQRTLVAVEERSRMIMDRARRMMREVQSLREDAERMKEALRIKKIQLDDRQQTLERGFAELRKKQGVIYG